MSTKGFSLLRRSRDTDMTTGNVAKHLILFALPLIAGNLFQQLYNMVDTWVVGNFVSDEAFSAVGTVAPVINVLIFFFMGLANGCGVVISQFFGAQNKETVRRAVHSAILMTFGLSILFTVIGVSGVPLMLRIMRTPADVFPDQKLYLQIYFSGIAAMLFYNMGAGILRAVGDSTRPFFFLVTASLTNIVLDLVFVIWFGMGVEGVALATILSQALSAILVLRTLFTTDSVVRITMKEMKMDWQLLRKMVLIGLPAAIQSAITSFSNVFVQSYINQFGKEAMGGWTVYAKVDAINFLPIQSLQMSAMTFVGQNLGRNQVERAKKGANTALAIAVSCTAVTTIIIMVFAPQIVWFFNKNEDVLFYGVLLMRRLVPFQPVCAVTQVYAGALRGSGDSKAPMYIMLLSYVVFRQVYLFVVSNFIVNEFLPLAAAYPAGWILCAVITFVYYRHTDFGAKRVTAS